MIVILREQNIGLAPRSAARNAAVRREQAPILRSLVRSGATDISSLTLMNALVARMSAAEARLLAANPAVAHVLTNDVIAGPPATSHPASSELSAKVVHAPTSKVTVNGLCGSAHDPQLNPEALTNINATPTELGTNDGAGVTVAFLADGLDPSGTDFQRNAAYGTPGQPVVRQYDFSSDGTNAPTQGNEAFGDASSIAAQGNAVYDLSQYVTPAHPLPSGCDIKIVGAAPGANVEALKVFATDNDTTESGILEAINFAVASGAKVINESFASTSFPDTALDVTREANDAAVAAGVTVVVSAGDAGGASTIGSPAADPNVISVGATTTFRAYTQLTYGGINDPNASGAYVDNNISGLSSGGYTQGGNTVDLVAPGDLNWALCSPNRLYASCYNESYAGSPIQLFGGTSESAPFVAAGAADVISAYAATHNGQDPTPTLVKEILMSTATDIGAPATEQGAGLLNVLAAVKEAKSVDEGTGDTTSSKTSGGGLLLNPGQINVVQGPDDTTNRSVQVTNTGADSVTVDLATRMLSSTPVGYQTGDFCLEPAAPKPSCPANTGSFATWTGAEDAYQDEHFTVPPTTGPSRLEFAADHTYSGPGALLNFALIEPNGTYAAYSLPQGLGDYGEVEVTDPPPGRWTAVFFAEGDGIGTSGMIRWSAETLNYVAGSIIAPDSLTIGPGKTANAQLTLTSSNVSGDTSEAIVVSSPYGTTTVPVTMRTTVALSSHGGTFSGVLTGGNGRGALAATNTYGFNVPYGQRDLDVSVALANDPQDDFIAELIDPNGQTVSYSTNAARKNASGVMTSSLSADLYALNPVSGEWSLIVEWLNPVSGLELDEPFSGTIQFNQVDVTSDVPNDASIARGATQTYDVKVTNSGDAPEEFFLDPRLNQSATINLRDQNFPPTAANMTLPLSPGLLFPYYAVPSQTTQLQASVTATGPVTFDLQYYAGDPDVTPGLSDGVNTSGSIHGDSANVTLSEPEISSGTWLLNPGEIGPFPSTGAPTITASAFLSAVTQAFNPSMTSSTGDLWSELNGLSSGFSPIYVAPGATATIPVTVTPSGAAGTQVSGTLYVDDYVLGTVFFDGPVSSDQLAALPYSYTIAP